MQQQSSQNLYNAHNERNNFTERPRQPTASGNGFRQKFSRPAQRMRHYQASTIYTAAGVNQNVVLGPVIPTYATRTPHLPQIPPQFYPHMYYPHYVRVPVPQQQCATVNPGIGVGLNRAMAIDSSGSVSRTTAAANHSQLALGGSQFVGIANTSNTMATQTIGGATLFVGLQQPQKPPETKRKLRSHALEVLDPTTGRNILLEDSDDEKNEANNVIAKDSPVTVTSSSSSTSKSAANTPLHIEIDSSATSASTCEFIKSHKKLAEIAESPICFVQPVEEFTHEKGKSDESKSQLTDNISTLTAENSVQHPLPANHFSLQQVPQQNQLKKDIQKESSPNNSQISKQISSDNTNSKEYNCIANDQNTFNIHNIVESVKIMQLEVKEDVTTTSQQNKINTVNYNEQPQENKKFDQQKTTQLSNSKTATALIKSTDNVLNNNEAADSNNNNNNNSNKKNNNLSKTKNSTTNTTNTTAIKTYNKYDKKKKLKAIPEKNKTTAAVKNEAGATTNELRKSNKSSNKKKCETLKKTNEANISAKNELISKQNIASSSTKPIIATNLLPCTGAINNEEKRRETETDIKTTTIATTAAVKTETGATSEVQKSNKSSNKKKDEAHEKTDGANISSKNELISKQKNTSCSTNILLPFAVSTNDEEEKKRETETHNKTIAATAAIKNEVPAISDLQKDNKSGNKKKDEAYEKTDGSTIQIIETNVLPSSVYINNEGKEKETETGNDNSSEERINQVPDNTVTNDEQSFELLVNFIKRYSLEELKQLSETKLSRIRPVTNKINNFSLVLKTTLGGSRTISNDHYRRGGAESGYYNRNSGNKAMVYLDLSLNQEVKLKEADNAWRPKVLIKCDTGTETDPQQTAQREKEELIRRVRGILNKLTAENFEPLVEEVIKLKIDTMDKMEGVMILVFEKAVDEPNFSKSYASLCQRLINEVRAIDKRMEMGTKNNLAMFRTALLDKTEQEFNQNVTKSSAKEEKLKIIKEKINECKDESKKIEYELLLDEEERKIRRRSGGTVRFIGELFQMSLLTGNIINCCIEALLKEPNNEDMLECLCKLLTTVGKKFEQTNIAKREDKYSLDSVIKRMQQMAVKNEKSKISSRIRFMLQDVIDLRKRNWQSMRNETAKTMEQIAKEANNEQITNTSYHSAKTVVTGGVDGGSGGSGFGKRDERSAYNDGRNGSQTLQQVGISVATNSQLAGNLNNDDKWQVQTSKGNRSQCVDTTKLFAMTVDMNNRKMGSADIFQWKKNTSSQQPTSTSSNSFAALSLDSNRNNIDRDEGSRNKGSYNKGAIKRDQRYGHDKFKINSGQAARTNLARSAQGGVRGAAGGSNFSNFQFQKSGSNFHRDAQQPQQTQRSSYSVNNASYQQQQQLCHKDVSDSTQRTCEPFSAVFEHPSASDLKLFKSVTTDMIETAAISKSIDMTTVSRIKEIKENQICGLIYYIFTDYLHLASVNSMTRRHLANVVAYLMQNKLNCSSEHFLVAYKNFFELADDLMFDIPELWLYIFEFTGPLIVKKLISINDLWSTQVREDDLPSFSQKFLKTFLNYCTREVGPSFTRHMWRNNNIKWTSFMSENEVGEFIQINKFTYVENDNIQPEIDNKETKEKLYKRVVEHIEQLLKEGPTNTDNIIDYINGNIIDVDKTFIKSLTPTIISFAIKHSPNCSLDRECFTKICLPLLLHYLDSKKDLELECLAAIQLLESAMELPKGFIDAIVAELCNAGKR